jgi:hypothetical protein
MAKTLSGSVGEDKNGNGLANKPADVAIVQDLLNIVPVASGGPADWINVDGIWGKKTKAGIMTFQKNAAGFKWPDGIVSPKAKTLLKLNEFESLGSRSFQISRWELRNITKRDNATIDRFYGIRDVKNGLTAMYWFGATGDRLADANGVLTMIRAQPNESTSFTTKEVHSVVGFPCKKALHSEISSSASQARFALSLPLAGELLVINCNHQWLAQTSAINRTQSVNGTFNYLTVLG